MTKINRVRAKGGPLKQYRYTVRFAPLFVNIPPVPTLETLVGKFSLPLSNTAGT